MTLLAVGHGTRDPAGVATVRAVLDRVRSLRPALTVAESYAEITEPSLEAALTALPGRPQTGPVVAVPLMLGRGHHACADIPGRIRGRAVVARPLGPHPLLTEVLAERLRETRPADAIVLGAAGTSDPSGVADVAAAARLLGRRLGRTVPYGFAASAGPALTDVVADLRARGARRIAIASYLIAPGFFHERVLAAGADDVSRPLGVHRALARLIVHRYDEAFGAAAGSGVDRPAEAARRAG
ncbi:sirohydrochlorin chelatase [Actinomadura sp. HBU206391]|uniref:sirohydrochlorin chelatase n=1 Tax=Actinomadura sp. HBU206391 TaxID=2731692 RepID=UPI001650079D|nr:sirohydrochlorin chelatase [Actinomadura sp. HBU206391]MBC6459380.1 sirohydrochlorin chelatase [Actinomadura sp. HBU206391]